MSQKRKRKQLKNIIDIADYYPKKIIQNTPKTENQKEYNDPIIESSLSKYSINETKRKKLINVLDDLMQLKKKLDNN